MLRESHLTSEEVLALCPHASPGGYLFSVELGPPTFLSSWVFQGEALCYEPRDRSLPGSYVHADSPGQNTGVSSHSLLQGIFPTQGLNLGLLHCRQILYCLSHEEAQMKIWGRFKSLEFPRDNNAFAIQEPLASHLSLCS